MKASTQDLQAKRVKIVGNIIVGTLAVLALMYMFKGAAMQLAKHWTLW